MNHETSFANEFSRFMEKKAAKESCAFHAFSVDSQDRDVGGDYVISDSTRFAIVEFKYTEKQFVDEGRKPKRLALCRQLADRIDMRKLHDRCHVISWLDSVSRFGYTNIYRKEVCNQAVFGELCGLDEDQPRGKARVPLSKFADSFFHDRECSASLEEFERYIAWLMRETSGSERTTVELMGYDPLAHELVAVLLPSIADAHSWMQTHRAPPPAPTYSSPSP